MIESAAHLVDEVFPQKTLRQWVLSFPFQLRFLFASQPKLMNKVLILFQRALSTFYCKQSGFKKSEAKTGSVTFIQRFGGSLNLNIHFHTLSLDGIYNFQKPITERGQVVYKLKTPYQNGSTHILFEPLDFLSRLPSFVPKPKINLTRFFGIFAPHSKLETCSQWKNKSFQHLRTSLCSQKN